MIYAVLHGGAHQQIVVGGAVHHQNAERRGTYVSTNTWSSGSSFCSPFQACAGNLHHGLLD